MVDVEWMFGDVGAAAHYNPLRWSGGKPHAKIIEELKHVVATGDRPIVIKTPSGIATPEKSFNTAEEAIEFVRSRDPEEMKRRREAATEEEKKRMLRENVEKAQAEVQNYEEILARALEAKDAATAKLDEALAADGAQESRMCEWMFADAGIKPLGSFGRVLATWNPMRWSMRRTFERAKAELDEHRQESHPISLRIPPGPPGTITKFSSVREAIEFLEIEFLEQSAEGNNPALSKLQDDKSYAEELAADAAEKVKMAKTAAEEAKVEAVKEEAM